VLPATAAEVHARMCSGAADALGADEMQVCWPLAFPLSHVPQTDSCGFHETGHFQNMCVETRLFRGLSGRSPDPL
jgi:hypothetical protein